MIGTIHFKTGDFIAGASTFLLVMALWIGAVIIWYLRQSARRDKLRQRMEVAAAGQGGTRTLRLWYEGKESVTTVPGREGPSLSMRRLGQLCHEAGWTAPVSFIIAGLFGGAVLAAVAAFLATGRLLVAAAGAVAVLLVFWTYLKRRISARGALFERQLVDALDLAARSLRAGHPLVGGFQLIAEEVPAPVGTVFAQICQQQAMGLSLERAVQQSAVASSSADMKLFGTAVVLQLRSGGNLADMMERLAYVIRDRIRLNRRVRVLTAQAQFSKNILAALPVVFFVLLTIINPSYTRSLHSTVVGQGMLVLAALLVIVGMYLMNRMMVLRF